MYKLEDLCDLDPPLGAMSGVRVVLLNGPPGSGKDSGGKTLECIGFKVLKFAGHLKRSVYADHGLPLDLPLEFFDPVKELPQPVFHGKSWRQACIDKSELMMKPAYGQNIFGRLFLRELWQEYRKGETNIAVTDSGFTAEAEALIPYIGAENMLLIRLHAEERGKSFAGDSRNYITLGGIATVDLYNNEMELSYQYRLIDLVQEWGLQSNYRG